MFQHTTHYPYNRKYIMYRNTARGGPNHSHRRSAHKNFVTISPAVTEIYLQTDRHTDRRTDCNTPLPCQAGVITIASNSKQDIPQTVFEAVVRSARKDVVRSSELFQIAKSLKLRRVDNSDTQWMHLDVTVDWVIEHLLMHIQNSYTHKINYPESGMQISKYLFNERNHKNAVMI